MNKTTTANDDKLIKSVRRTFEILELFNQEKRPLAAKEIAKRLGYPISSAHLLLKTMHKLGYAEFDESSWEYTPSLSFPELLSWVSDHYALDRAIIEFAEAINRNTGELVNLSRQVNTRIKIFYGFDSNYDVAIRVKAGTVLPVTRSLTGIVYLAALNEKERTPFLERVNQEFGTESDAVDLDIIEEVLAELERRGSVMKCDYWVPGLGGICVPLRSRRTDETIILGVAGPSYRIQERHIELRRMLKWLAADYDVEPVFPLHNPR